LAAGEKGRPRTDGAVTVRNPGGSPSGCQMDFEEMLARILVWVSSPIAISPALSSASGAEDLSATAAVAPARAEAPPLSSAAELETLFAGTAFHPDEVIAVTQDEVYERDLGEDTAAVAEAIHVYDPSGWTEMSQ
jgi:Protein of unknown function (DUF2950)